jgi:ribonuclease HII
MLKPFFQKDKVEAGCDEAGRGCLAGPVFAAAVILPQNFKNEILNDSKQLSEKKRYELREIILAEALAWSVAQVDEKKIDEINILNASILAMHQAVDGLKIDPNFLIIDGNRFKKYKNIEHKCFVKGDGVYASIAAASILAKTFRDDFMNNLHNEFPQYDWINNKAYGTKKHVEAIMKHGFTPYHRKTFHLKSMQREIMW